MQYIIIISLSYNIGKIYLPVVGLGLSVVVGKDSETEIEYIRYEYVYHFCIFKKRKFVLLYNNICIYRKPRF